MYYPSSVWSNKEKKIIIKLRSVQNFASRITGVRKYDHVTPNTSTP